jgi:hypothetical protein
MTMEYQSVAVVDANQHNAAVWQVDVGVDAGLTRMCGAWLLQPDDFEKLKTLTEMRYLVPTPSGAEVCSSVHLVGHRGVIDLGQTLAEVDSEMVRLQEQFEAVAAKSKSKLIAPTWPRLPTQIDLANPPRDIRAPTEVAAALGIARWLESVALAWESLEQQRLIRRYLRGKEANQRPFPIVIMN